MTPLNIACQIGSACSAHTGPEKSSAGQPHLAYAQLSDSSWNTQHPCEPQATLPLLVDVLWNVNIYVTAPPPDWPSMSTHWFPRFFRLSLTASYPGSSYGLVGSVTCSRQSPFPYGKCIHCVNRYLGSLSVHPSAAAMGKNSSRRRGQDRPWRYERRVEPEIPELTQARAARREQATRELGRTPPQPPPAPVRQTGAASSSNEPPAVPSIRTRTADHRTTLALRHPRLGHGRA